MYGNATRWSDQPGRVLAVLVFAPLLVERGCRYDDKFLLGFGVLLFVWDLFFLLFVPPRQAVVVERRFL